MVEIHAHDPAWQTEFQVLGSDMRRALGPLALRIDHIGSTSVESLGAKPIIDIQVSVKTLDPVGNYLPHLNGLGYIWRSDNPEKTKRYFRESPGTRRVHVHVRKAGSWHEQYALLFRDYVRAHTAEQHLYEGVKRRLALQHRSDAHAYTEAKGDIFWDIMRRADVWAANTGWEPGPSDA